MAEDPTETRRTGGVAAFAEDATGFGAGEFRLTRDLLLRPRAALTAYYEHGSQAGGLYPRPFRYFLTLNGIMMLILFLMGGFEGMVPPELRGPLEQLASRSGKSTDAFMADFDSWSSFLVVPVTALFIAVPTVLLLRWWGGRERPAFRGAFAFLSAWTLLMLPFCPFFYRPGAAAGLSGLLLFGLGLIPFLRMGRGVWFRSPAIGLLKGVALLAAIAVCTAPGSLLLYAGGALGAFFGP